MEIEAFLLCDCATAGGGKLNVLGAFDVIWAKQMPAIHPACAVVTRARFSKIEEGTHEVRITIIDEDGNIVGPDLKDAVSVTMPPNQDSVARNLILNIHGLRFNKPGQYRIDLSINNQQAATLPIKVFLVKKSPQLPENN
ncbi:MAG: hypothetical protein JW715_03750 [Sedimentisphaerales bacterium]|nr:hypothetical protein [Sedimentisphaerales bacterium]